MANNKKDRMSQKQPEAVNGLGANLQIASANNAPDVNSSAAKGAKNSQGKKKK